MKLLSADDPFFSTVTKAREDDEIDLGKMGMMFALEKIDAKFGYFSANA